MKMIFNFYNKKVGSAESRLFALNFIKTSEWQDQHKLL